MNTIFSAGRGAVITKTIALTLVASINLSPLTPAFAQEVATPPATINSGGETVTPSSSPIPDQSTDSGSVAEPDSAIAQTSKTDSSDSSSLTEDPTISPTPDTPASTMSYGSDGSPTNPLSTIFTFANNAPKVKGETGALTEEIQLDIPPGRNGVQPDLKLQYNSQRTTGSQVGYGWSLSIPYIERLNKTGSQDLYNPQAAYFTSSIDGELATTSSDGSSPYRARIDDGSFVSYSFANNTWTAYDKQGTRYLYGSSDAGRQYDTDTGTSTATFMWMLQEIRDTNDNYVQFTYTRESNELYPDEITYTGHGVSDGIHTVTFTTASSSDVRVSYASGFMVTTNKRISEIDAAVDGTLVRKYLLSYSTGNNGTRSLLASIQHEGYDDDETLATLPPMTFSYVSSSTTPYTPGYGGDPATIVSSDTNGNGINDSNYFADSISNPYHPYGDMYIDTQGQLVHFTVPRYWAVSGTNGYAAEIGTRYLDVNADGKSDLIGSWSEGSSTSTEMFLNTFTSANQTYAWEATTTWNGVIPIFGFTYNGKRMTAGIFGDVNGDGLPDFESKQDYSPYVPQNANLGNGSAWIATTTVFFPIQYISTFNPSPTASQLVDVNGDGLDDWVYSDETNTYVLPNTGRGWDSTPASQWTIATSTLYHSPNTSTYYDRGIRYMDINGDGLPDFVRSYYKNDQGACSGIDPTENTITHYVMLNTGNGWASATSTLYSLAAIAQAHVGNYPNLCWDGKFNFNEFVNKIGNGQMEQDVLSIVTYPTGGSTSVTYTPSAQLHTSPELPVSLLVVTQSVTDDGRGNTATTSYSYADGKMYLAQGVRDRKFAGFASVTTTLPDSVVTTYYNQGDTVETNLGEQSDGYGQSSHPFRVDVFDLTSNIKKRTFYRWDTTVHGNSVFVGLSQQMEMSFAANGTHQDKATAYSYSSTNDDLLQTTQYGEVTGSADGTFSDIGSDKRTVNITYAASTSVNLSLPTEKTVLNSSGATTTNEKLYYDALSFGQVSLGNLTKDANWIIDSEYASTTKSYNSYGLVATSTDARGNPTSYAYDAFNLYPATTTNALSQATTLSYNYSNGAVKQSKNPNGGLSRKIYDGLGRVTEVDQSDLDAPQNLVTVTTFQYTDNATPPSSVHRSDYFSSATTSDTYDYLDGLGRPYQQRTSSETPGTFVATDRMYNAAGELASKSLPYFSSGSALTSPTDIASLHINYTYDALQRPLTTTNAVGSTTNAYSKWTTSTTDPNGHTKDYISDAFGNLAQVVEHASSNFTTSYSYDASNNLTAITDASGNDRNFTYDGLGRRLTAQDLHAPADGTFGSYAFTYDAAGNLTQKLDPKNQTVNFTYDALNRPLTEDYTGQGGTEIMYAYDTCVNGKGRLCVATSTDAVTTYTYNILGLPASETKNVAETDYQMQYDYDRQGNPVLVTYPDNSVVRYGYGNAGFLQTVDQKPAGSSTYADVISGIDYAPTGAAALKRYGNGLTSTSTYNSSQLYRLTGIMTIASSSVLSTSTTPGAISLDSADAQVTDVSGISSTYSHTTAGNHRILFVYVYTATSQTDFLTGGNEVTYNGVPMTRIGSASAPDGNGVRVYLYYLIAPALGEHNVVVTANASVGELASYAVSYNGADQTTQPDNYTEINSITEHNYTVSLDPVTDNTWMIVAYGGAGLPAASAGENATKRNPSWGGISYFDNNGPITSEGSYPMGWSVGGLSGARSAVVAATFAPTSDSIVASSTTLQNMSYAYDATGNITRITDSSDTEAGKIVDFTYDGLDRLITASTTGATSTPFTQTYSYDALGNLTYKSDIGAYTYAGTGYANPHALTNIGAVAKLLVVAGGGAGGGASIGNGGGGGAGGYQYDEAYPIAATTYSVTVGQGGTYSPTGQGGPGGSSTFGTMTAVGGGGGGRYNNPHNSTSDGGNGGSGGGGGQASGGATTGGTGSQGSNGGNVPSQSYSGGGGGGASAGGASPSGANGANGGAGGAGIANSITGTSVTYAGGGGGSSHSEGTTVASGGAGGGGNGRFGSTAGQDGASNTGGGGGGGGESIAGGNGGSGVVIIAFPASAYSYSYTGTSDTGLDGDLRWVRMTTSGELTLSVGSGGTAIAYDNNGNATSAGSWTYAWDYRNRMLSSGNGSVTTSYGYDHNNQRVWQKVTGSATTTYPSKYYTVSGATTTANIFLPDGTLVAYVEANGSATSTFYVHPDHLGSTNVITDASGTAVAVTDYYPFGSKRVDTVPNKLDRQFIGERFDSSSGLSYLNARYYDSYRAQFISQDPVFWGKPNIYDPQSLNAYSYSEGNPITGKDPTGLSLSEYSANPEPAGGFSQGGSIGQYRGIPIYSHGSLGAHDYANNPYQCATFVQTFVQQQAGLNLSGVGNAVNYSNQSSLNAIMVRNNSQGMAIAYSNGASSMMPQENDIITWSGGGAGHTGIIVQVDFNQDSGAGTVWSAEQNFRSDQALFSQPLSRNGNGNYSIHDRGTYQVQSWTRYGTISTGSKFIRLRKWKWKFWDVISIVLA